MVGPKKQDFWNKKDKLLFLFDIMLFCNFLMNLSIPLFNSQTKIKF